MGRVAPAPLADTYQSESPKSMATSRLSPVQSESCVYSPLHENERVDDPGEQDLRPIQKDGKTITAMNDNERSTESYNTGRWGGSEKRLFLEGLRRYGKGRWKQIGKVVKTRSLVQIKSHGQKVLKKLEAGEDIFAELDKEYPAEPCVGKLEYNETDLKLPQKTFKERFLNSFPDDQREGVTQSRTAVSRFAWILPTRTQLKEQEQDNVDPTISSSIVSIANTPPRKRKGRKKEPKAKVARTDISMVSAGSVIEDLGDDPECSLDLQQDTAVAVQALSTLFLSTPAAVQHSQTTKSYESYDSSGVSTKQDTKVLPSRVEDAQILLSLMGKSSNVEEKFEDAEVLDVADVNQSTVPWWHFSLRRKN